MMESTLDTMTSEEDETGNEILSRLPYLVVEALLSNLDIFAFKTLRTLCRSTKQWIETPEVLRHFPISITNESRMIQILSSECTVPWNNFIFLTKCKVSDSDIKKFLLKYAEFIKILEFNWPQEKMHYELKILSSCPNLESIRSNQICFETILPCVLTKNMLKNWKHLKHFHVQRFRGGQDSPLVEMEFFESILKTCSELQTVTIPQFNYDYKPIQGFEYIEALMSHVISPLISYIKTGKLHQVTVPCYGLTDEIFVKLSRACKETGTVLFNVRSTFLKSLPDDQLDVLDIIGSLDGISDTIIRAPLPNIRNVCFVNPSFNIENNTYKVPLLPNLTNVEIDFKFSRKSQKSMELFVNRLAKIRRPTVKSLKITYQPGPPVVFPIYISPLDLVTSFVNLRVLHIKDWEGEDEQFVTLWRLAPNVVELSLANCKNLTDRGILGDDLGRAAILQLQYLRKLSIINYLYVDLGVANITEMSFIHAFRHMRLKSFHFFDGNLLVTEKTIPKTALESLRNGVFGSTIEDFILQETDSENCDIMKRKVSCGDRREKWKYGDHHLFSRSVNSGMRSASSSGLSHNHVASGCSIV